MTSVTKLTAIYPGTFDPMTLGHEDLMRRASRLFERLAKVAHDNPLATRREGYSAQRLARISDDNRWICFPYPRLMNANAIIDQASAARPPKRSAPIPIAKKLNSATADAAVISIAAVVCV